MATALRQSPTIVIYGSRVFFGGLVVTDLLDHTDARLFIASWRLKRLGAPDEMAKVQA